MPLASIINLVSDLVNQAGSPNVSVLVNGKDNPTDNNGGTYMWDENSTGTHDGFNIIQSTGTPIGRWRRQRNTNYTADTATFSGVTLQTSYTINHGLGMIPTKIFTQPKSLNAAALSYIDNITATTFRINFITIPVLGTNNIVFDWLAIK